jgi:hypothetical protein
VPVIIGTRLFDKSTAWPLHGVGVVESQNPLIAGVVQGQFIANAMRPRVVGLDDSRADLTQYCVPTPIFVPSRSRRTDNDESGLWDRRSEPQDIAYAITQT